MNDDREQGFILLHRRLLSSPLYRALTHEQRSVFFALLLLANWKESRIMVDGIWHPIQRGELCHSLESIAEAADVSTRAVRNALAKLCADDIEVGGRGPFLKIRKISTRVRILTIVNYGDYQASAENGVTMGSRREHVEVTKRSRQGHDANTSRSLSEEGKQGEQGKQEQMIFPGAVAPDAESPKLPEVAPPSKATLERRSSHNEAFAASLLARRREVLGPTVLDDVEPRGPRTNALVGKILAAIGEEGARRAFEFYLADNWARTEVAPPCALRPFLTESVWRRHYAKAEQQVSKPERDWKKGRVGAEEIPAEEHKVGILDNPF